MSKTSNDPTKTSRAQKDAQLLTDWLREKLISAQDDGNEIARCVEAVAAMPVQDALRFLAFNGMASGIYRPRLH